MKIQLAKLLVTIVLLGITMTWVSCKKKNFTQIEKIEVKGQGSFVYKDGLTLLLDTNGVADLNIDVNSDDFKLFYSINNEATSKLKGDWITVDSTANFIDFYTSSQKPINENFRLGISYGQDGLIDSISKIYPNPVSDTLNFVMESQTRGIITLKVFNVLGQELESYSQFVSDDNFDHKFNFNNFQKGVYFLWVEYGGSFTVYRVLKN